MSWRRWFAISTSKTSLGKWTSGDHEILGKKPGLSNARLVEIWEEKTGLPFATYVANASGSQDGWKSRLDIQRNVSNEELVNNVNNWGVIDLLTAERYFSEVILSKPQLFRAHLTEEGTFRQWNAWRTAKSNKLRPTTRDTGKVSGKTRVYYVHRST